MDSAQEWLASQCKAVAGQKPRLTVFAKVVVHMVIDNISSFPSTFGLDIDRLKHLQSHFTMEVYQAACIQVFTKSMPRNISSEMFRRLLDLSKDRSDNHEAVALEIVRQAYCLRGITAFPNGYLVDFVQSYLQKAISPNTSTYRDVRNALEHNLTDLVHREVGILIDLGPLQMSDYPSSSYEVHGMANIAKRTAHIAVLHWKIWAPILYEQPRATDANLPNMLSAEEMTVHYRRP